MDSILRSNNFARILAIILAIILWLFVTGDKITRTTPSRKVWQDVPLRVENLDQDYVVTDIPSSVDVTLEGLPDVFEDLAIHELDAYVDLAGKEPGTHLVRVQGRPPRGLNLVMLEPEQVRVTIEVYHSDDFPVVVEFLGEPAEGWELADWVIDPESVFVGAPESIFEQVDAIILYVDLTGMRSVERINLNPLALDEDGNPVTGLVIDPAEISVRLVLERIPEPVVEEEPEEEIETGSATEPEPEEAAESGN
ncbi:MAG: CdaR family protein [Bacillota bacterium]|nr:CdaR family protein [Bacillota bacterium]